MGYHELHAAMPVYERMRSIADRVSIMRHRRAVIAYHEAFGLDPKTIERNANLDWCVIHNSILDRENGRGWREVNYSKMRLAARLLDDLRASRLVDAFYQRKWAEGKQGELSL
jgi:hypothetical protein